MKRYKRNKQKMKIKDLQDFQYQRIKQKRKTKDLQDFLDADLESIDYSEKSNKETALEKIMATHIAEEQRYIDEQVKKHHPEYTTPAHEPEELDKKKVFESRDKVMQANVRGIFQWVVNQFERPEMSYRELVQNSRDAETPQIDIKFTFNSREDERKGVLQVDFEDYGTGMDLEERKEFYMKLFNSSKEGNTKKTGRFGIGLVSIFALEPDEFITESCKNGEAWKQHIWDLQENDFKTRVVKGKPRQGTKITLVKYCSRKKAKEMREDAFKEISQFCKYLKIPMYFRYAEDSPEEKEVKINKPFDIDSPVKIHFKRRGIEGVIGITQGQDNAGTTELMNNRLLIKTTGTVVGEGLDIIVSSEHLNYNISRNDVVRDENYEMITKILRQEKQNLIDAVLLKLQERVYKEEEAVEKAETLVAEKKKKEEKVNNYVLWRYLATFIQEEVDKYKDIDPLKKLFHKNPLGNDRTAIKLFKTADGDYITLGDLIGHRKDYKPIYYTLDQEKDKRLLGILSQRKIKTILLDREEREHLEKFFQWNRNMRTSSYGYYGNYYYENSGLFKNVISSFTVQEHLDDSELTEEDQAFLTIARKAMKRAKVKKYSRLYLGDYSDRGYWTAGMPFLEKDTYSITSYSREALKPRRSFLKKIMDIPISIKNSIFLKQDLIINKSSDTIQKYMEISKIDEDLATDLMTQHIKLLSMNHKYHYGNPAKFFTKFYGIKKWQKQNKK